MNTLEELRPKAIEYAEKQIRHTQVELAILQELPGHVMCNKVYITQQYGPHDWVSFKVDGLEDVKQIMDTFPPNPAVMWNRPGTLTFYEEGYVPKRDLERYGDIAVPISPFRVTADMINHRYNMTVTWWTGHLARALRINVDIENASKYVRFVERHERSPGGHITRHRWVRELYGLEVMLHRTWASGRHNEPGRSVWFWDPTTTWEEILVPIKEEVQ